MRNIKATSARYYQKNKHVIKERNKAWSAAHPEKRRHYALKYYRQNRDEYMARNCSRVHKTSVENIIRLKSITNCAICNRNIYGRNHHIDHDHQSGRIRGVLCGSCNRGIGYLQDSSEILRAAADYLEATHFCCS